MGRMRRALLVLPLLVLPACGGGGDGGDGGDSAKAAYVAAAVKVCEVAKTDAAALKAPAAPADFKPFVDGNLAIATRARTELDALTPPPADADALRTKVLDPFAALVSDGEAFAAKVTAAGTDQAKLLPLLAQVPTAEGVDLEFLRSYGLGVCADVLDA